MESIEARIVSGVLGFNLESLEELGECPEVLDCVFAKAQQMLTHQVTSLRVRQECLLFAIFILTPWNYRCMVQDDVKDLVVALLDGKGGRGSVPKVLLIWVCPCLYEELDYRWPPIGRSVVQGGVSRCVDSIRICKN